ncbi:hypothetical protein HII31_01673 [Pseudocercospora fuligena]|uniref:Uncharacterized protein n=1 Tax=Pseudocercospora fuligena TaxID=685502 RepID=A0A8H6RU74_9PEZI|nr:hypothetical protein HII31_01673 [Pseudocercospora fuligena]
MILSVLFSSKSPCIYFPNITFPDRCGNRLSGPIRTQLAYPSDKACMPCSAMNRLFNRSARMPSPPSPALPSSSFGSIVARASMLSLLQMSSMPTAEVLSLTCISTDSCFLSPPPTTASFSDLFRSGFTLEASRPTCATSLFDLGVVDIST